MMGLITTSQAEWDRRMFQVAVDVASWSKDPHRKVGALIVSPDRRRVAWGYNGFPFGVADLKQRLMDEDQRLALTVHAERNALDNAPFDPAGATLYVTRFPCHECAKGIITRRIARVVAPGYNALHETWGESWRTAEEVLREAGVALARVEEAGA